MAKFNPGIWYGIELKSKSSSTTKSIHNKGDGTVKGIKYFQCKTGNAIFRRKEDLYSQLAGNTDNKDDILIERNIKPSMSGKHHSHNPKYDVFHNKDKNNKDNNKLSKRYGGHHKPNFAKSTSAPYAQQTERDKSIPLMDLQQMYEEHSGEDIDEIKDNDAQSNETKEEEYDFYDDDMKPKLEMIDASDEIYADDEDEYVNNMNNKHKRKPRRKSTSGKTAYSQNNNQV